MECLSGEDIFTGRFRIQMKYELLFTSYQLCIKFLLLKETLLDFTNQVFYLCIPYLLVRMVDRPRTISVDYILLLLTLINYNFSLDFSTLNNDCHDIKS